jgi:transposase
MRDLPISGFAVSLTLVVKRFFCRNARCERRVFCERLPSVALASARRTCRLSEALRHIGLLVSGETSKKILAKLGVRTSADTLLRCARTQSQREERSVRVIGIDEWAYRKGHSYGTIIVDHEQNDVVALLPDRDALSVQRWLEEHPELEVVTRDRLNAFGDACTWGAPQAAQVLDRWHLLRNLFGAFERLVARHYGSAKRVTPPAAVDDPRVTPPNDAPAARSLTEPDERRLVRIARFRDVKERLAAGWSKHKIARELRVSRQTIHKYSLLDDLPEHGNRRRQRPSKLDAFKPHLKARAAEGCFNALRLYRELRQRGYDGGVTLVKQYVRRLRKVDGGAVNTAAERARRAGPASVRLFAWWLLLPERLPAERRQWVRYALDQLPELQTVVTLVREGWQTLRDGDERRFERWRQSVEASGIALLQRYVSSLLRESRAVRNALALPWSNGRTEGHVNRLKTIKRSMYGRANFDLLQAKVLYRG